MKFTCLPSTIKNTLQTVSKIAPSKPSLPILSGVLLAVQGNAITMRATDLDQSIRATVNGIEVYSDGSIVVPKKFLEVLNKLPNETVIFESDGAKMTIQYGKNKFNLNCFDAEKFPQMPEVEGLAWKMDFDPKKVAFAASKEQSRPIFMAVHLNLQGGDIVATDTHRIALIKTTATENGGAYNVPAEFLVKIPVGAVLKFGENMVSAQYDEFVFSSRIMDGTYPNYKMIFSDEFSTEVNVSANDLGNAVQRAQLIKETAKFEISKDGITISAKSESGSTTETIAAEVTGDNLTITFPTQQIIDALKCCPEEVTLGFGGALSPVTVMPGGEWQGIILPMRPDGE